MEGHPSFMTSREKRTVRFASIGVIIYLALFFGWRGWRQLEARRAEYGALLAEAQRLQRELQPYENRVLLAQKLKQTFQLDPQALSRTTLVAQASAAIQKTAASGGIQLGPVRESPARTSAKELASVQLEGVGPVQAVVGWLQRLQTLGYPLVIDAIQFSPEPSKPGMLKVNLAILILNFEQWKNEKPHA